MTPDLLEKINNIVNVELIPQQLSEKEEEESKKEKVLKENEENN